MKLGEKLQQLRRQSGLSQEQLASQLTVSRQAVSKWELDETMPDTDNVVQLARLFGVSCDYLLRDEVDQRGAALADTPQPAAPGEADLDEKGWVRNATALPLAVCAIGLLLALGGWLHEQTSGPLIIGLIIQVGGLLLFELAVPRMGSRRKTAHFTFYMVANWLLLPIPMAGLCWWIFGFAVRPYPYLLTWAVFLSCDILFSVAATVVLAVLRWRQVHKA